MEWVSTFPKTHHLKGGESFWRIWIEEFNDTCIVYKTKSGTFLAPVEKRFGSFNECKEIGNKWGGTR